MKIMHWRIPATGSGAEESSRRRPPRSLLITTEEMAKTSATGRKTGAMYGISFEEEIEKNRKIRPNQVSRNRFSVLPNPFSPFAPPDRLRQEGAPRKGPCQQDRDEKIEGLIAVMHPGRIAEQVLLDKEKTKEIRILLLDEDQPGSDTAEKIRMPTGEKGRESPASGRRPEARSPQRERKRDPINPWPETPAH